MPSTAAARRASSPAWSVPQQRGASASPPFRTSRIHTPTTSSPRSRKSAEATDESTPPLIATKTGSLVNLARPARRLVQDWSNRSSRGTGSSLDALSSQRLHVSVDDGRAERADGRERAALVLRAEAEALDDLARRDPRHDLWRAALRHLRQLARHEAERVAAMDVDARHADAVPTHVDVHSDAVAVARIRVGARAHAHTRTAAASRSRATIGGSAARNASTSASVVSRPTEMRSDPCATRRSRPSATSTCDGSVSPDVQADPLDTAKPARSS